MFKTNSESCKAETKTWIGLEPSLVLSQGHTELAYGRWRKMGGRWEGLGRKKMGGPREGDGRAGNAENKELITPETIG